MKMLKHLLLRTETKIHRQLFLAKSLVRSTLFSVIFTILAGYQNLLFSKPIDWSILAANDTMSLYFNDVQIGSLLYRTSVDSIKKTVTISSTVDISTIGDIPGNLNAMELHELRRYDFAGRQMHAYQKLKSTSGTSTWELSRTSNNSWMLNISAGGIARSVPIDKVAGNLSTTYAIQSGVLQGTIKKGEEWQDTVFDLTAATHLVINSKCTGVPTDTKPYYTFLNRDNLINRDERWEIDTKGRTLLQEIPPFFTAKRYSANRDKNSTGSGTHLSLEKITELFKVSKERGPDDSEVIALTFKSGGKLHESVNDFYSLRKGCYLVNTLQTKCRDKVSAKKKSDIRNWLTSTVTIQSDHREILELSASLKGTMKNRCRIIEHFNSFVYKNITKEHIATFSNAYETLKSGKGDCGEHAALLAALLRAAGIESNVVLGLVYIPSRKGYFYHAWVVAYAGRLLFADPALGEFPASVGYIPLVLDDSGTKIVHLASLIERINISYLKKSSLK